VGKTPLTIGRKEGKVKVKVALAGKEKESILKVIAGKETAAAIFVLKGGGGVLLVLAVLAGGAAGAALLLKSKPQESPTATTGSIQVTSNPQGAKVYLDGTDTGKATNCTLDNVSPGDHTVKLAKEGYVDYQENVSVTAGQTAAVNVTLTMYTITVTNPTSSTVWITGTQVDIKWQTSGSASSQGNIKLGTAQGPLSFPGKDLLLSFPRRDFQRDRSLRTKIETKRGLENPFASENSGRMLDGSLRTEGSSKTFSSVTKEDNIIRSRTKNLGIIKSNKSFGSTNLPLAHELSAQKFIPFGNTGILGITNVKIDLYKGGTFKQTIVASTANSGSYTWTVDSSLTDGTDYKVRISCAGEAGAYGESAAFKIEAKSITVTKPTSTTVWSQGYSADITWTSKGSVSNAKIDLYKGTVLSQTIVASTSNTGSYTWTTVPTSLADGSDYKVRVSDASASGVYGESAAFKIEAKSITVTNPRAQQFGLKVILLTSPGHQKQR